MSDRNTAETGDAFIITHKKEGDKNIVKFEPTNLRALCEYKPVSIEMSNEQWDALRYHFATMVDDKNKVSKLAYVY